MYISIYFRTKWNLKLRTNSSAYAANIVSYVTNDLTTRSCDLVTDTQIGSVLPLWRGQPTGNIRQFQLEIGTERCNKWSCFYKESICDLYIWHFKYPYASIKSIDTEDLKIVNHVKTSKSCNTVNFRLSQHNRSGTAMGIVDDREVIWTSRISNFWFW